MPSPQHFMAGTHSSPPFQRAFSDLALELANPISLRLQHRDLVLQLDERQPRHPAGVQLAHDLGQLLRRRAKGGHSLRQELSCLWRVETVHEHETGREIDVLACGSRNDVADDLDEKFAARLGEPVDRALRPSTFLLALARSDHPGALEHLDRVVELSLIHISEPTRLGMISYA